MRNLFVLLLLAMSTSIFAQTPPIEPGVSHELAKWRAARYSDVRYKLNLTLEKMSPVLKGTMEIRLRVGEKGSKSEPGAVATGFPAPIILDWRKIKGFEGSSTISNVSVNGEAKNPVAIAPGSDKTTAVTYDESSEHLIFRDGVVAGENVIKLDFTSPILTSGSAITRYVDKEDGAEYVYSLFVPSDASTAFPVFDQPDLKARFWLDLVVPKEWKVVSNTDLVISSFKPEFAEDPREFLMAGHMEPIPVSLGMRRHRFFETKPISSYVFAFSAGEFDEFIEDSTETEKAKEKVMDLKDPLRRYQNLGRDKSHIYVRKSQAAKFKTHAAEVFRLNREAIKYFEQYFDYKFPFPKYDLVLIPEFPFGGMEHAGATFLRESSIIFPQEPTKNDLVSRATLIFHESAHQWFGDTVTMRWFDDLWLKEGFATFTAYKAMEKIMPEMNAWKVFYERIKQGAYQTDSTKGTTPIYQEIKNLSAAKSAYGNIVYNKAPAFLRQAEFFLGEDKFRQAVRAFLKKHEFGNAEWTDLVEEFQLVTKFQTTSRYDMSKWADTWVKRRGLPRFRISTSEKMSRIRFNIEQQNVLGEDALWPMRTKLFIKYGDGAYNSTAVELEAYDSSFKDELFCDHCDASSRIIFPNYGDYGYGIFLLDEKSREYVLKNIQNETDPFLRTMMWGSLWDSVREGELDPREYVELIVRNLSTTPSAAAAATPPNQGGEFDESTIQTLLGRVSTAMTYYLSEPGAVATGFRKAAGGKNPVATAPGSDLRVRLENLLIDRMKNAPTLGQRITFYRAFLNVASTENARRILREILNSKFQILDLKLKTKDKFDIVTRLLILSDPDAPALLAGLEKTETSDEAKRYAYAAKAGIATAENKAKYWNDFTANKDISESWIEAAFGPFNSVRHAELTLPYLERALKELPNHKRNRKIFFVNGWLGAFIGGQRSEEALAIVNKFLADNPNLDKDLRLKILENVDLIERAVKIRANSQNRER